MNTAPLGHRHYRHCPQAHSTASYKVTANKPMLPSPPPFPYSFTRHLSFDGTPRSNPHLVGLRPTLAVELSPLVITLTPVEPPLLLVMRALGKGAGR